MSLSVKHYHGGFWIDISDYVAGAGDVPYISRNRDWTLRAESWSVSIASTIRDHASYVDNFVFSANERIAVWNSTKLLLVGYIKAAPLDYREMVFNLEVVSDIQKIDNYKIDYDTLHSVLTAGSPSVYEYRSRCYYVMPTVHYLYLMKKMFLVAGLILDTSEVDNVVAFHYTYDATYNADVMYKELFVGESELYCLNQSVDAYHSVIDNNLYDYNRDKITFFELIKELCGILSLMIIPTSIDNYKIILPTVNYTISDHTGSNDDSLYEYQPENLSADELITNLGLDYQDVDYTKVLSTTAVSNMQTTSLGKGGGLNWLSKLRIMFIYEIVAYDTTKAIAITNAVWATSTITITTSSAHGLIIGDPLMIFGMAGMISPNNSIYDTMNYSADTSTGGTTIYVDFLSQPSQYLEGGWIYKDNGVNYVNSYRIGYLYPCEITTNATNSDGGINVLLNQIKSKSSNYLNEIIECPIQDTDATVVENFIDLENRTSKIIQETY